MADDSDNEEGRDSSGRSKIGTYNGETGNVHVTFMTRFGCWVGGKGCGKVWMSDVANELVTDEEFYAGEKPVTDATTEAVIGSVAVEQQGSNEIVRTRLRHSLGTDADGGWTEEVGVHDQKVDGGELW